MRLTVLAAAAIILLSACAAGEAAQPAQPPATQPVVPAIPPAPTQRFASVSDLGAAVDERTRADRTFVSEAGFSLTAPGGPPHAQNARVETILAESGPPTVRFTGQDDQGPNGSLRVTEIVVTPEKVFVRPDRAVWGEPRPPWLLLDPQWRDDLSAFYRALVESIRGPGSGVGCLSETGTTTITAATPDRLDGVDVIRYDLRIRPDDTGTDQVNSQDFRRRGLTELDTVIYVDGENRLVGCDIDLTYPDGTTYVSTQRLVSHGDPVRIEEPPADQVYRLPNG